MAWTQVGNYTLRLNWQFTDPVEGTFFRLKFSGLPAGESVLVAQAQIEGSQVELYDIELIQPTSEQYVLEFEKPAYLTNRRIAFRRQQPQPTVDEALRRNLEPRILVPSARVSIPQKYVGAVTIEVSDAIPRANATHLHNRQLTDISPEDGQTWVWNETDQLWELGRAIAPEATEIVLGIIALAGDLGGDAITPSVIGIQNQALSDTPPPNNYTPVWDADNAIWKFEPYEKTTSSAKTLTYVSNGDTNGLFYWLGTDYGNNFWTNPHTSGKVLISLNAITSNTSPATLVDRVSSTIYNDGTLNGFIKTDIGVKRKLSVKHYSLRNGSRGFNTPRNWRLEGSNNDTDWTLLKEHISDTTISTVANSWGSWSVNSIEAYRYLRLMITNSNSDASRYWELGEIEFYGDLTTES